MQTQTKYILLAGLPFALLAGLQPQARAQGGVPLWTNRYNVGSPRSVALDTNGNVFVTGSAPGVNGFYDYLTLGYSGAGIPLWTNRYDGPANDNDFAYSLAVDTDGNVFVMGYSDFASGGGAFYTTIKYSSAGLPLWTNWYNSTPDCYCNNFPRAMVVDRSGNVFVTGRSPGVNLNDYTTIKYSGSGVPLWTNRYNGQGNSDDGANAIAVDSSGNVFVTGYAYADSYYKFREYATVAYSNTGERLWTNLYNQQTDYSEDEGYAIAVAANGNVFVTGFSWNGSNLDYVTLAYSGSGVPLWINRYDGPGNGDDSPTGIVVDSTGNVFVTGFSWSGSDYDYATLAYSNSGVPLWTNRYGGAGSGDDRASAIGVDSDGNVFVTGSSWNGSDLDYATLAYSNAGVPLWTNRYNGPANSLDVGTALAVDASGNVVVTGSSYGSSTNSPDFATIKYSSSRVPAPRLNFQRLNNQLVLSWTNVGSKLQSAPAITGRFTNIPGATSPYTNAMTAAGQFFRLISN